MENRTNLLLANRVLATSLLLFAVAGVAFSAAATEPQPEILGLRLGMSRDEAHTRLKSMGSLEKEERKRQEVWAIRGSRVSHLLVGFDPDLRVRYVTAVARADGQRIRYDELADVNTAKRTSNQGNYTFRWEVAARRGQPRYLVMARGRDAQYLETYSVKNLDE